MEKTKKLMVTSSPHITDNATAKKIMADVIIALIPALIASTYFFGFYAFLLVAVCVVTCVLAEYIYTKSLKKVKSINDLSAVITGILLGLNLPPRAPIYFAVIGGVVAIILVKMLFGGIGKNFANPAMTARVFLLLCFGEIMSRYITPLDYGSGFFSQFFNLDLSAASDAAATATSTANATPLSGGDFDLLQSFLGNISGSIGETSSLALLLGGAYLIIRRVIDYKIPLIIVATVAAFAFIFTGDVSMILPAVLSGGLLLGAIFMATDYATSPNTTKGIVVYAFAIGAFTAVIRQFSYMPEGISFAILLGNLLVPLIDKYIYPKPLGYKERKA